MGATRSQLKQYFRSTYTPTQNQFFQMIDAFFNLEEDVIGIDMINGLPAQLGKKADQTAVTQQIYTTTFYRGTWSATYETNDLDNPGQMIPGYLIDDVVDYQDRLWRSIQASNTAEPGSDTAKWIAITPAPAEPINWESTEW